MRRRCADSSCRRAAGAYRSSRAQAAPDHGRRRDDKVEIAAVTDYAARLLGRSHPVSLLVAPGEGHVVRGALARRAQLHLVLRMLQAHLGGPPLAPPDKELADFLTRNLRTNGALPR
jgi:hypothetical protein